MIKTCLPYCLILVVSVLLSIPVKGQDCDRETLRTAEELYKNGNFNEVVQLLEPCIESGFHRRERAQAYRYLSYTYIAIDSMELALEAAQHLIQINPYFEPDATAPPRFASIISLLKGSNGTVITSVSKKAENIKYAPATVVLLTEQDILDRGYENLEQLLYDLPGFDVIRGNGPSYSNFYQRGYRSISNDRTLLLIDGVEENDLVSDHICLSRQYTLSDIKQVEIVYGPASTMYGANAFVGVINIVAKSADSYLKKNPGHEMQAKENPVRFGSDIRVGYGSYNSKYIDGTYALKTNSIALTVTNRIYSSDERDLSGFQEWEQGAKAAEDYYDIMSISGFGEDGILNAQNYINTTGLIDSFPNSTNYQLVYDEINNASEIKLTEAGAEKVSGIENEFYNKGVKGYPIRFNNHTLDWFLKAKLKVSDFTISFMNWKTDEGLVPWYTNTARLSTDEHSRWITWNKAFFIDYNKTLFEGKVIFSNIASYRLHEIDGGTNYITYNGYFNKKLSFYDLETNISPQYKIAYLYRVSNQLRDEFKVLVTPSKKLDINSSIDFRSSLIQGNYIQSNSIYPEETGLPRDSLSPLRGGNNFRSYDIGFFTQVTYSPIKNLKCIGGGRIDYKRIRTNGGYGFVFNPRLSVIYGKGPFVYKAIYAEAFKDASNLQKYATTAGRKKNNPNLLPERVKNIELCVDYYPTDSLSIQLSLYNAWYSDVIGTANVIYQGEETTQFKPIGKQQISGAQLYGQYRMENAHIWGNFTYTNPVDIKSDTRISDIADFMFSMGGNKRFILKNKKSLHVNLWSNFVGPRRTGIETSGSKNIQSRFDPYFLINSTLTYNSLFDFLSIQLTMRNLLNTEYAVPGIREADNITYAYRFPQDGRIFMVKLLARIGN